MEIEREILETRSRTAGERHPETLRSMNNLGWTLIALERFEEGEGLLKNALIGWESVLGMNHPNTRGLRESLINRFKRRDKLDEVITIEERYLSTS